jgi:hypothetical protein
MKKLFDYIRKNDGVSANVWTNGKNGYGFNIPNLSRGFMVSLSDFEQKIPSNRFTIDDLKHYTKKYADMFSMDIYMLGVWHNKNVIYLDISVRVLDINRAIDLLIENEQKAFYDLSKGKSFDRFLNEIND